MDRKELDAMWFKALHDSVKDGEDFTRYHFAALVAAAEREACAKVCEHKMPNPVCNWSDAQIVEALRDCAAAIRARGETK